MVLLNIIKDINKMTQDKKLIDADALIDVVDYQCSTDNSAEALKWRDWFVNVINAQYNREHKAEL